MSQATQITNTVILSRRALSYAIANNKSNVTRLMAQFNIACSEYYHYFGRKA